nr:zinc ribbon domain-containing protein [uncultured Methanoregula sp.]
MPFCPDCGTEITPGNKFCTECGAPVEEAAVPARKEETQAALPPVPKGRPGANKNIILVLVGIIAVCMIVSVVILSGMFVTTPAKSSSATPGPHVSVTPTSYAIVTDLYPEESLVPVTTPTTKIVSSERFGSNYERVYSISKNFSYGEKVTFAQNLTTPPLYIKFNLMPVNISRHILVGIGTHQEHMVNTTEVSPNAWFEVKVYDTSDEHLVEQEGFGKDYSDVTNQEFMVRQKGNYRIEFSGHEVSAAVDVLTGIA